MIRLFCLLLMMIPQALWAQGTSKMVVDSNQVTASFGFWNWTEKMTLTKGATSQYDWANLQANSFGVGVRGSKEHWGYDIEALFLSGKAAGGGLNSLNYQQGNINFSGYGGSAGIFYRTERYIELGAAAPVIFRSLNWPNGNTGIDISSGANPLIAAMVFWRFRPSKGFLIEQGFGPAGVPSQSIWNLQAQVLF